MVLFRFRSTPSVLKRLCQFGFPCFFNNLHTQPASRPGSLPLGSPNSDTVSLLHAADVKAFFVVGPRQRRLTGKMPVSE
jgi:hypothetical protein